MFKGHSPDAGTEPPEANALCLEMDALWLHEITMGPKYISRGLGEETVHGQTT
jgi:hypothetical protein